jgi:DNA-binding transcriptional MerR regulator
MFEETGTMRVGEVSDRTGVSARSLRYYEQQGLLAPCRGSNGYREYDELSVIRAANIRDLMAVGLTVEDIRLSLESGCLDRPLNGMPACEGALQVAADRLAVLDKRINALIGLRDRLAGHLSDADTYPCSAVPDQVPHGREAAPVR